MPKRAINVTMPSSIAFNLEKFVEVQKDILGRLGCRACTSGHDIRWNTVTNFGVGLDGDITEIGAEQF